MPAETVVIYLPFLTQRNPALWGEDADEFDPERWIDRERLGKYVANPAMYAPFSAGPRIVRLFDCLLVDSTILSIYFAVYRPELCL
jgi:hypothetical protein